MNITTATPAEIDTEIARINAEIARREDGIDKAAQMIARYRKSNIVDYYADAIAAAEARIAEYRAELPGLVTEVAPLHAEFDSRGGWTRWYLVEGGHLHYDVSSHRCSRILTTSHYWITELSGQAEAEVIELAGERVCTTCFPNAPVAVLDRPSKLFTATEAEKEQARIEREDKRTAKALAKAAKAITNPDGTPLVLGKGGWNDKIETERAASIRVVDLLWYNRFYSADTQRQADIELLLTALAAKHDVTVEVERAAAEKRLAARIKREG